MAIQVDKNYKTLKSGKKLYRRWSDLNVYIQNEKGQQFTEAIDPSTARHTYTETDIPIEEEGEDE